MKTFLERLVNYEKVPGYKYDLDAYREFLRRLGSPQENLKNVILIGGTKGKGSTAAILNSCLRQCGYRVGLYTSPHLYRVNERIKVDDRPISDHALENHIRTIRPLVDWKNRAGARTYFEVLTAIAFLHFIKQKVDFTILEVGLGGRLDATNVSKPLISVVTRIGYDHTDLLGTTLERIAFEKAGIIQTKGSVITIHQRPAAERVLISCARKRRCRLTFADQLHKVRSARISLSGSWFDITGARATFEARLPLIGRHQGENLLLALAVLAKLKEQGWKIDAGSLKKGLRHARLNGRFEILSRRPLTIYDVAHNPDSFRALGENLKLLGGRELYFIFGCNRDKDIAFCVKKILSRAKEVVLVKANHPRAMEPIEIYEKVKKYQKNLYIMESVQSALGFLKASAGNDGAIIIFGTFFLAPEIYGRPLKS